MIWFLFVLQDLEDRFSSQHRLICELKDDVEELTSGKTAAKSYENQK